MIEKFEYEYEALKSDEKEEIESIRSQYLPKSDRFIKMDRLKKLHSRVHNIPLIIGLSSGIIGTLLFGIGMCFFLVWNTFWWMWLGLIPGILGIIIMLIAYPIYKKTKELLKRRYSKEILSLSEELLK